MERIELATFETMNGEICDPPMLSKSIGVPIQESLGKIHYLDSDESKTWIAIHCLDSDQTKFQIATHFSDSYESKFWIAMEIFDSISEKNESA